MFVNIFRHKDIRGTWRIPWMTIFFLGVMLGLYVGGSSFFYVLLFDKTAILNGEVWRLMTGHLVHYNVSHLFWDMLAFLIIASVIELNNPKHFIPSLLTSCGVVSMWLLFCESGVTTYCGLSGALNGMLVLSVVMQWKITQEKMYLYVLLATLCKIVFEMISHQAVFADLSVQPLPSSHAAGFMAGIIYLFLLKINKNHSVIKQ